MYNPVARETLAETVLHLRGLFREVKPRTTREEIARDAREIFTRNLLGNLGHLGDHTMPQMIAEAAQSFHLTVEGAHQLFGYDVGSIRDYDLRLNATRTRIIESYPFRRDFPIELPLRFRGDEAPRRNSLLSDLVSAWQRGLPIRQLTGPPWQRPKTFYVQVGTDDSLGSKLPPGAIAAVEPISKEEQLNPDIGHTYLLQFGNGYLCSGCRVIENKLSLTISDAHYHGPYEFAYPGAVRIAGRIRNFALSLPLASQRRPRALPRSRKGADLLLPWQFATLPQLLAAKNMRFRRPQHEIDRVRSTVASVLQRSISARTERRYRGDTSSTPHVNALIELSLLRMARYSDVLHSLKIFPSDHNRYSLETLMSIEHLSDLPAHIPEAETPQPQQRWSNELREWGEWPTLLSMKFPHLQPLDSHVVRLHQKEAFNGLEPLLPSGSLLLLEECAAAIDTRGDHLKTDWARPIYALYREGEIFCGYLEADRQRYVLVPHPRGNSQSLVFRHQEVRQVRRAVGAAIPCVT